MANLRIHSCEKCGCCAAPGLPALCPDCIMEEYNEEEIQKMADLAFEGRIIVIKKEEK